MGAVAGNNQQLPAAFSKLIALQINGDATYLDDKTS